MSSSSLGASNSERTLSYGPSHAHHHSLSFSDAKASDRIVQSSSSSGAAAHVTVAEALHALAAATDSSLAASAARTLAAAWKARPRHGKALEASLAALASMQHGSANAGNATDTSLANVARTLASAIEANAQWPAEARACVESLQTILRQEKGAAAAMRMSGALKACCNVIRNHANVDSNDSGTDEEDVPATTNESAEAARAAIKLVARYAAVSELTSRALCKDKALGVDGIVDIINGTRIGTALTVEPTGVDDLGTCTYALELLAALCKFTHSGEIVASRPLRLLHALSRAANKHTARVDVVGNIASVVKRICKLPSCRREWLDNAEVACIARRLCYDCMLDVHASGVAHCGAYKEYKRAYRALCLLSQNLVAPSWGAGVRLNSSPSPTPMPHAANGGGEEVRDESDETLADADFSMSTANVVRSSGVCEMPDFTSRAFPELVSEWPSNALGDDDNAPPFSVHVPAREAPTRLQIGRGGEGNLLVDVEKIGGGARGSMVCELMLDRARSLVATGETVRDGLGPMIAPRECFWCDNASIGGGDEANDDRWLAFASDFPGANLRSATCMARDEYDLVLSEDRNDASRRVQWFFFEIRNAVPGRTYRFNVVNFNKKASLYERGCQVLMRARSSDGNDAQSPQQQGAADEDEKVVEGQQWQHVGNSICYYPSPYRELQVPSPPPQVEDEDEENQEEKREVPAAGGDEKKSKALSGKKNVVKGKLGARAGARSTSSGGVMRPAATARRPSVSSSTPSSSSAASNGAISSSKVTKSSRGKGLRAGATAVVAANKITSKAGTSVDAKTSSDDAQPGMGSGLFALTFDVRVPCRGTYQIASGFPYGHADLQRDLDDILGPEYTFVDDPNAATTSSDSTDVSSQKPITIVSSDGRPPRPPRPPPSGVPSGADGAQILAALPQPRWPTETHDEIQVDGSAHDSDPSEDADAEIDASADGEIAAPRQVYAPRAPPGRPTVFRSTLCKSFMGRNVDLLTFADLSPGTLPVAERPVVVVTARVHPGESCASWVARGMMSWLVFSDDVHAEWMRTQFVVKMVPMLNPDGVELGSTRCSSVGVDLNRKWGQPSRLRHPCIYHTRRMLDALVADGRALRLFLDLHGHSRREGAFMFGVDPPKGGKDTAPPHIPPRSSSPAHGLSSSASERDLWQGSLGSSSSMSDLDDGTTLSGSFGSSGGLLPSSADGMAPPPPPIPEKTAARLRVRAIPVVFAARNDAVDLRLCSYKCGKGKNGCGRVVVAKEVGVPLSYTLEVSHAGGGPGALARRRHYRTADLEALGADLLASVAECHSRGLRLLLDSPPPSGDDAADQREMGLLREVSAANAAAEEAGEDFDDDLNN